jgi:cysteine protease ATG4
MDPSMLIGFLIRDEQDWENWQREVKNVQGKSIIHIAEREPTITNIEGERADAIDEVESFDEEEDGDGLLDT